MGCYLAMRRVGEELLELLSAMNVVVITVVRGCKAIPAPYSSRTTLEDDGAASIACGRRFSGVVMFFGISRSSPMLLLSVSKEAARAQNN